VVILASERYKRNEISAALKLDPRKLNDIINGRVRLEVAAVQHEHRDITPIRQPMMDDSLSNYSKAVQFVGRSLIGVAGVSEAGKKALLDKLEADRDMYFGPTAIPGLLKIALINASVSWYKVDNIIAEYELRSQRQMGSQGQGQQSVTGFGSSSNWMERMIERELQFDFYEQLQEIRYRYSR